MQRSIEEEVSQFLATLDQKNTGGGSSPPPQKEQEQSTGPEETYHIYPVDGGLVILKEGDDQNDQRYENGIVVDSVADGVAETLSPIPTPTTQDSSRLGLNFFFAIFLALLIPLGVILFDLTQIFNPPTATITIIPIIHSLTTTQTLQIASSPKGPHQIPGQVFTPLLITQSITVPATGHAHQDARAASGTLTFYNLSLTAQTIDAGTAITGADGIQIVTDQTAIITPASQSIPPQYGQTSVSAHALNTGPQGDIQRGDINGSFGQSVLVQNPYSFRGGMNARDFTTVTKSDISSASSSLLQQLNQSAQAALNTRVSGNEQIITHCSNQVKSDHQIGQEASLVAITGNVTCQAAEYDVSSLQKNIQTTLTNQLGPGYTLLSQAHIQTIHAQVSGDQAFIQIKGTGLSFYQIEGQGLTQLKRLLAGKTEAHAHEYLASLPWVSQVNISGLYDNQTRLPTDTNRIKMTFIIISV